MTIEADFSRYHELLALAEAENKAKAVKRWLTGIDQQEWLLVFDNADDLSSVKLQEYLPGNWAGHVLITSRDPEVIGQIADGGLVLDTLAPEDAVELLLRTAGMSHSLTTDQKAEDIVMRLGCLPLALDQAGAFIRARHKQLQQYLALLDTAQRDLLTFRSRLSTSDVTVLSTWEINFRQIENESDDASMLLLLLSFLNPSRIEEVMLCRGTSPQRRWNEDGTACEVNAEDEGVASDLVQLLQDEMRLDQAVEKLRSFSLISLTMGKNDRRLFLIHPLVQYCATQRIPSAKACYWTKQAISLVCHALPRNHYLDPANSILSRSMLPHLAYVLSSFETLGPTLQDQALICKGVGAAALSASRFSDRPWKTKCMARANAALTHLEHAHSLQAELAHRESCLLRLADNAADSDARLREYMQRYATQYNCNSASTTVTYNAHRGNILISLAENDMLQHKYEAARLKLSEWRPLNQESPSVLEGITLRARDITLGKTLRHQGSFNPALDTLHDVLAKCEHDEGFKTSGHYRVLVSNVADLYCECGHPAKADTLLQQALKSLLTRGGKDSAVGQRLRLALAETYIQRAMYDHAMEILEELEHKYCQERLAIPPPRKKHVFQALIGLARIHHHRGAWDEALKHWHQALDYGRNFDAGIVQLSIALVLHRIGEYVESHKLLSEAKMKLETNPRVYWYPRFASAWYKEINEQMTVECTCEDVTVVKPEDLCQLKRYVRPVPPAMVQRMRWV